MSTPVPSPRMKGMIGSLGTIGWPLSKRMAGALGGGGELLVTGPLRGWSGLASLGFNHARFCCSPYGMNAADQVRSLRMGPDGRPPSQPCFGSHFPDARANLTPGATTPDPRLCRAGKPRPLLSPAGLEPPAASAAPSAGAVAAGAAPGGPVRPGRGCWGVTDPRPHLRRRNGGAWPPSAIGSPLGSHLPQPPVVAGLAALCRDVFALLAADGGGEGSQAA
jgi:hypothetical protein